MSGYELLSDDGPVKASPAYPEHRSLTEADVRRIVEQEVRRAVPAIVLDVLERWLKTQDIEDNYWMNRGQREFAAITAVRKEMGL